MQKLTYADLVTRYGENVAYDLLLIIEQSAKVEADTSGVEEETRLQRALAAMSQEAAPA